ncbi:hypothetical protein F4553_003556 [Allocatelliglobosispora scoriae]|uniref:Uncharacterized protein n=1 Tax=Allocatelliglobosispora scoriae TaxID=643052 RepID=A0A841BM78_9ACTN|nr:hypothetical protein [Allocatelliglobosispora scoriae]MBB5870177.1 hypothetical protein [Allocatelliglobosispora scoriae]
MSSQPLEQAAKSRSARWRIAGGVVVGVATVIGTIGQVWPLLFPPRPEPSSVPSGTVSQAAAPVNSTTPTGTSAAASAPTDGRTYLSDLRAAIGRERIVAVPKSLAGQPGFEHAFAVRCPSNNTGDMMVEVSYELPRGSTKVGVTLIGYQDKPPINQLIQLTVFPDAADRLPGAPFEGEKAAVQAAVGASSSITANVTDAFYVRLRIECRRPGGTAVVSDAYALP